MDAVFQNYKKTIKTASKGPLYKELNKELLGEFSMKPKSSPYITAFFTPSYNSRMNRNYKKNSGPMTTKDTINKAKDTLISKGISPENALKAADNILNLLNQQSTTVAGKLVLGILDNGIKSLANNSYEKLAFHTSESVTKVDETKVYKRRFVVGRESSSSLKQASLITDV